MNDNNRPIEYPLKNGQTPDNPRHSAILYKLDELTPENNDDYPWNDLGMAELFNDLGYRRMCRYCPDYGRWFVYENGVWKQDDKDALLTGAYVKEFQRLLAMYASQLDNDDRHVKFSSYVSKLGDNRARKRILEDARELMRIEAQQFDANPYLVNCLNGTYDLKRDRFYEHKAEDFLTMQTAFEYSTNPNDYERWTRFINEIMDGDREKARYLQKALGYSILGLSNEACMFIEHGSTTRNGKSTLNNAIQRALGDYSTVSPVALICKQRFKRDAQAASPELAKLKGKRFVTMSESPDSGKLDAGIIKQLTGGEEIPARAAYGQPFTFVPQMTIWLSCNDLPGVDDETLFTSNRIRLIEFTRHFSDSEQDKSLDAQFSTPQARMGIFKWLVEGYKLYRTEGLTMPVNMTKAVKQYESDNDIVLQFIESQCRPGKHEKRSKLYNRFKMWAHREGYTCLTNQKFYGELTRHGHKVKPIHGNYVVEGLELNNEISLI